MKDIKPYEVLGLEKSCGEKEIKRAYHRLCLKYHPDKNDGFREEFDRVQVSYMVLSNSKLRSKYDRTGIVSLKETGEDIDDEDFDWDEYFRGQFQEINKEMIEKDREEYQGSEEEENDIKREFVILKGDMSKLFEVVIHLEFNIDEERRIFKLCENFIKSAEIKTKDIPKWEEYLAKRDKIVQKMERKRKREEKAADKVLKEKKNSDKKKTGDDLDSLRALIAGNSSKHRARFSAITEKYGKAEQVEEEEEEEAEPVRKRRNWN